MWLFASDWDICLGHSDDFILEQKTDGVRVYAVYGKQPRRQSWQRNAPDVNWREIPLAREVSRHADAATGGTCEQGEPTRPCLAEVCA